MSGQNFLENSDLKIQATENEIEFSVFGRGFGECILIKYAPNSYAVVDSFRNSETHNPIVLDYFEKIGEVSSKIDRVIVTHWHNDHIMGISDIIFKSSKNVKIVLSPIIQNKDFLEFIAYNEKLNNPNIEEFVKVMQFLHNNPQSILIALKNKTISEDKNNSIKTLSPHDSEVFEYICCINNKLLNKDVSYDVPDKNDLSLVVLFKYDNKGVLLGGDLENCSGVNKGWNGILNDYNEVKSKIFKVPHHGSKTGYNEKVWTDLLEKLPTSIVTTFNKGFGLPTESDIDRIQKLSKILYVIGKSGKRNRNIERLANKTLNNIKIKSISQGIGLVRYRYNMETGVEKLEYFGDVKIFRNS